MRFLLPLIFNRSNDFGPSVPCISLLIIKPLQSPAGYFQEFLRCNIFS